MSHLLVPWVSPASGSEKADEVRVGVRVSAVAASAGGELGGWLGAELEEYVMDSSSRVGALPEVSVARQRRSDPVAAKLKFDPDPPAQTAPPALVQVLPPLFDIWKVTVELPGVVAVTVALAQVMSPETVSIVVDWAMEEEAKSTESLSICPVPPTVQISFVELSGASSQFQVVSL